MNISIVLYDFCTNKVQHLWLYMELNLVAIDACPNYSNIFRNRELFLGPHSDTYRLQVRRMDGLGP